jgi:hypothetical protein
VWGIQIPSNALNGHNGKENGEWSKKLLQADWFGGFVPGRGLHPLAGLFFGNSCESCDRVTRRKRKTRGGYIKLNKR